MRAGQYLLRLNAYESGPSGERTNTGFLSRNIRIKQVPTSLEIFMESVDVEPGENLRVKIILYDQSGEKIHSNSAITIKNNKDKLVEKADIATDEFFEYPIARDQSPSDWKISAVSNNFSKERVFKIIAKESISIEIHNQTLVIANTGNVLYNKTALVKIGNSSLNIDVFLDVGKNQEYLLTAPNGNYRVEVITDDNSASGDVLLTGDAINIKKASENLAPLIQKPFVWAFMVFILGFVAFVFFQKGYKKTFVGRPVSAVSTSKRTMSSFAPATTSSSLMLALPSRGNLVKSQHRAEILLSIKGEKQEISLVTLYIKNFDDVFSRREGIKETLSKISDVADKYRAVLNESNGVTFFIISPKKTRTFKNEKAGLDLAQEIKEILKSHNKMFKQKIVFGISVTCGDIIARDDRDAFRFMPLGNITLNGKKLASVANDDVYLSDKVNERVLSFAKTTRVDVNGLVAYSIRDMKNPEQHEKFLSRFLERNR